jgi:UDP:flavonoid glycosyltransferase YjiC (YdhE family)
MANFLFCWELGGGLGHVTPLAPFAAELLRRGHRVLVAVRDVHAAHQAFSPSAIAFVAAPYKTGVRQRAIQRPRSYAHILHNNGFADANELAGLTAAWRNLYHQFQPHVIAFNHSPTALLAARGYPARRVLLGDGFCSPPPSTPLPIIRPWIKHDVPRLARDDEIIAGVANAALTALRLPALGQLSDLYREVDENFLLTYAELDHFGPRQGATYHGVFNTCPGAPPRWPVEGTRRVFAYLKPTPAMPQVLRAIAGTGCRLIVHGTWVRGYLAAEEPRFANIALMPTPVDLGRVLADCDAAILNATHGTTAAALLSGKPILQLPIVVEQVLVARNTQRLGAGLIARRDQPEEIAVRLTQLLAGDEFSRAAAAFARKYRGEDSAAAIAHIAGRLEGLAPGPAIASRPP